MPVKDLTAKQRRFITEYLKDQDAVKAFVRAGYSAKTAEQGSSRMMKHVKVAAEIEAGLNRIAKKVDISAARVLREVRSIAFSNHTHYMQDAETGRLVLAPGAPKRAHSAISSVKYKTTSYGGGDGPPVVTREVEFRLWNKNDALKLAGKHVGLFLDKEQEQQPTEIHIHGNIQAPVQAQASPVGPETTTT